jgi:hypothetical protein
LITLRRVRPSKLSRRKFRRFRPRLVSFIDPSPELSAGPVGFTYGCSRFKYREYGHFGERSKSNKTRRDPVKGEEKDRNGQDEPGRDF